MVVGEGAGEPVVLLSFNIYIFTKRILEKWLSLVNTFHYNTIITLIITFEDRFWNEYFIRQNKSQPIASHIIFLSKKTYVPFTSCIIELYFETMLLFPPTLWEKQTIMIISDKYWKSSDGS